MTWDEAARPEGERLALGDVQHDLAQQGRDLAGRADGRRDRPDGEDLGGDQDAHVLAQRHAARETRTPRELPPPDAVGLERVDRSAATRDADAAEPAGTLAAARRRDGDAARVQRPEESAPRRRRELALAVHVDGDGAMRREQRPRHEHDRHERHDEPGEEQHTGEQLRHATSYRNTTPAYDMYASDISPTTMNASPSPSSPFGGSA